MLSRRSARSVQNIGGRAVAKRIESVRNLLAEQIRTGCETMCGIVGVRQAGTVRLRDAG